MNWSDNLRTLYRGLKLGGQVVKAKLDKPRVEPRLTMTEASRLVEMQGFGDNPGHLRMFAYVPGATAGRALVVVLHGCGQDAAQFAADSGWVELADRLHIPLVLPEQREANNAGRCFQWFHPADTARDSGEAGSIAAMTRAAINQFRSDPSRVFIVGLSAGAAMAVAMLAAYPDLFAAGASVAGLPVGAARSSMQAVLRMASAGPKQTSEAWAAQARAAAPIGFNGPWPRLSIWQGQADSTVAPDNATLLTTQWRALHGLDAPAMVEQVRSGVIHRVWPDGRKRLVELWSLPLLTHAYPAGSRVVAPGRYIEQAPIDATVALSRFFGLD